MKLKKRRIRRKIYKDKECAYCNSIFKPNSGKQVCCSRLCNVKKWAIENPEKAKEQQNRANIKRRGTKRPYNSESKRNWYNEKKKDSKWLEKSNKKANERRRLVRKFIADYKIDKGCSDCGYNEHHAALDFDHIKGEKKINVCFAKSINQAKEEIKKCEVVCSNCHRIRTYNRIYEKLKKQI